MEKKTMVEDHLNSLKRFEKEDNYSMIVRHKKALTVELHFAAKKGHYEIVKLITEDGLLDEKDGTGKTALHLAAMNGHIEICHQIISLGSQFCPLDYDERTPLHNAAENGHLEICQLIIECLKDEGLPVNPRDREGITPLQLTKNEEIKELIGNLISPNQTNQIQGAKLMKGIGSRVSAYLREKLGEFTPKETESRKHP